MRQFEFAVRHVWPRMRRFSTHSYSPRCRRCAASEKMAAIAADGICELCSAPATGTDAADRSTRNDAMQAELHDLFVGAQGAGRQGYDALVLYSGGKDSTYLVRRLQNDYPGLRLLALTNDNGFMSPIAVENVTDLIGRLNVDHVVNKPHADFYVQLFRYCLTHLGEDGAYGTADFSDGEFLLDTARRVAAEKSIPLIVAGYSRYQVQNGLRIDTFESPRDTERSDRVHTAGLAINDIFDEEPDRRLWWRASDFEPDAVARLVFPLYCWDLEENEIKAAVERWGLLSNKAASPIATNHQLIPLFGVVDVHRSGYSSFEPEFCRMVREGRARIEDWQPVFEFLEFTARTGLFIRPTIDTLLARLDLSRTDVGIHYRKHGK
ncbi:MAG: hypothetical protein AB7L13_07045 [Acidimicrobiia bacterium]